MYVKDAHDLDRHRRGERDERHDAEASVTTLPPSAVHAPMASGSRKVEVMGPLATPPESKAMPTNTDGTNRAR